MIIIAANVKLYIFLNVGLKKNFTETIPAKQQSSKRIVKVPTTLPQDKSVRRPPARYTKPACQFSSSIESTMQNGNTNTGFSPKTDRNPGVD